MDYSFELLSFLKKSTGETSDAVLFTYLKLAEDAVLNRLYPFGSEDKTVPERFKSKVLRIAEYLLNKRGAEGETAHSENGISRSYENADIPESMLAEIIPFAGVL